MTRPCPVAYVRRTKHPLGAPQIPASTPCLLEAGHGGQCDFGDEVALYDEICALRDQIGRHPRRDACLILAGGGECRVCGARDCPKGGPGHYQHDGCSACLGLSADAARVKVELLTRRLQCTPFELAGRFRAERNAILRAWPEAKGG